MSKHPISLIHPLLVGLFFVSHPGIEAEPASRPNLILILADAQGWGDAGFHRAPDVRTRTNTTSIIRVREREGHQAPACRLPAIEPDRSAVARIFHAHRLIFSGRSAAGVFLAGLVPRKRRSDQRRLLPRRPASRHSCRCTVALHPGRQKAARNTARPMVGRMPGA